MRGLCYVFLSVLTQVSSSTVKVIGLIGHNVTLPCNYDTQRYGILSFCWGRGKVPHSKCSSPVLSCDDGAVDFRKSPRYKLQGRVKQGDVSLTILKAELGDGGVYGCRVEIPGWFNDFKQNIQLILEEAPEEQPVTEEWTISTEIWAATTSTYIGVGEPEMVKEYTQAGFIALLGVGNICRAAVIFFFTIIIILVCVFRREFQPGKTLEHPSTSAAENIYESVPCSA